MSCPVGMVAPDHNLNAACSFCGAGEFAAAPELECDQCPSGSFRAIGNIAPWDCTNCPFGQWQNQIGATYCLECSTAEWCLGGDECKEGHIGLACSECTKGWFIFQGSCFPCQKNARYYSLIFMGVVLCVGAIIMLVFADKLGRLMRSAGVMKKRLKKQLGKDERKRAAKAGGIVFIVMFITYLQIQNLMIGVRIPWPGPITEFFIALGAMINFDIWGMISPQCSVDMSFEASWMVRLVSPVAVLLPVAGGIYYLSLKPGKAELADRVFSVIMQVLHMMFVSTTLHSLQPFDCMLLEPAVLGPEGQGETKWVMERYPQINCDTSENSYFRMVVAGVSGFVIYTALYFLFVMYTLYKINGVTKNHETWVPPPGTLGHPSFIPELRAKKKRERAAARGEEVPAEEQTANVVTSDSVTLESVAEELEPVTPEKGQEKGKDESKAEVDTPQDESNAKADTTKDTANEESKTDAPVMTDTTDDSTKDDSTKDNLKKSKKSKKKDKKNPFAKPEDSAPDGDVVSETAGPVTEAFFVRIGSLIGVNTSSNQDDDKKKADEEEKKKKEFNDEDYVSDDEPEESEIIEARLHPEVRVLLKRYGLVILPYQQRAWFWELFSMMNKLLLAMTATFFSRTPKLQMELMLGQNTFWLLLLVFFRPFCAVPFKGGPMERFFADVGAGELKPHWSAGNIVETAMACGSVTISAMGVSVASGEGDPAAQSSVFFIQLFVILVFIGRALQTAGGAGSSFFGPAVTAGWVAARGTIMEFLIRVGILKRKKVETVVQKEKPSAQKSESARNRWAKLRAESGLSEAVDKLNKQPMFVKMALEAKRKSEAAALVLARQGAKVSTWLDEGKNAGKDDDDDLPEIPPGRWSLAFARFFIRFSPLFFVIFLAMPIAVSSLTASYGFFLDSSMDAFNIRDHPAAEDFTTFVNARDRSKEQRELEHYVTPDCVPDTSATSAARRKLLDSEDETQMHMRSYLSDGAARVHANSTREMHENTHGRKLLQATGQYEPQFCDRMRLNLFYKTRDGSTLLTWQNLLDMRAADALITGHPKYEAMCAKWSTPAGALECIPPHSLASYFFPEYSDGLPVFNGLGDPATGESCSKPLASMSLSFAIACA